MPRKTVTTTTLTTTRIRRFNEAAARCRGKRFQSRPTRARVDVASMRPRPDAAENDGAHVYGDVPLVASMRPRPDAAENVARAVMSAKYRPSFNEAAARCRGKPVQPSAGGPSITMLQ